MTMPKHDNEKYWIVSMITDSQHAEKLKRLAKLDRRTTSAQVVHYLDCAIAENADKITED